jgi:hypothetical protein
MLERDRLDGVAQHRQLRGREPTQARQVRRRTAQLNRELIQVLGRSQAFAPAATGAWPAFDRARRPAKKITSIVG